MEALRDAGITKVVGWTIKYFLSEAAGVWQAEADLRRLDDTAERIRSLLEDAEQRRVIEDESILKWLRDLKALAFDTEDLCEQFKARGALSENRASRKRKRSWCDYPFAAPLVRCKHYWTLSKKIAEIGDRYQKIKEDRSHLRLEGWEARRAVATRPPPVFMAGSLQGETLIHGRQGEMERIVNLLTVDGGDGLPVICIDGPAGLGKSALARNILKDDRVKSYFTQSIWVSVPPGSDVRGIMKEIIRSVTQGEFDLSPSDLSPSLGPLQHRLLQLLEEKTFLLVLDGVWKLDIQSWGDLRAPLVAAGESREGEVRTKASKVLVTTQNREVWGNMKAELITLEGLPDEDCWAVFCDHAFAGAAGASEFLEEQPSFQRVGRDIARKCYGSPLAAKLVGSHLYNAGLRNEDVWMDVQQEIPELRDAVDNIIPTLKLSYDHLPLRLKRCFAFCSIFPNGYEFGKDELVKLWVAVGLVKHNGRRRLKSIAADYFDQLVRRSFFQASHKFQQRDKQKYRIPSLIYELAQFVSMFDCLRVDHDVVQHGEAKRARYAWVSQLSEQPVALERIYENEGLRTFILHGEDGLLVRHILSKLFQSLRCLRVLDLSHSPLDELPDSLGDLILLRYLNLYSTQIESLPESVGNLYNLQTLELGNSRYFHVLPDSVGDLIQLRYLGLNGTTIERLPESLRSLSKLETLELRDCSKLRELPDWLGNPSFSNLETVRLSKSTFSSLPCLGRLPRLKTLHLEGLHAVGKMGPATLDDDGDREGFPVLQKLSLLDMPNLEKWFKMKDSDMPQLSELIISGCTSLGIVSHLPRSLETLEIRNCPKFICTSAPLSLRNLVVERCDWKVITWFRHLKSLALLTISDIPKLRYFLTNDLQGLTSLRKLKIEKCNELESLAENGDLKFLPSLKSLEISSCPKHSSSLTISVLALPSVVHLQIEPVPC